MLTHAELRELQTKSLKMQGWIRQQTFSPENEKTLRRFSSWEVAELILGLNQSTFRGKMAADPTLPAGMVEPEGRQRWFTLDEVNTLRRRIKPRGKSLLPPRPKGRAFRTAIANFKGGAGKSTVALHFAHAAALDGYRVLCVDFDPQATLSHSMGLTDVSEEHTVWGIMARDLIRETEAQNNAPGRRLGHRPAPADHSRGDHRSWAARPAGARFHPAHQLADDRSDPLLRQCRLCRIRLGAIPASQPRMVVLCRRLAVSRSAAG